MYIYTHIHIYIHTYIYICEYVYIYIFLHTYINIYIYTYIYIYIHIYICNVIYKLIWDIKYTVYLYIVFTPFEKTHRVIFSGGRFSGCRRGRRGTAVAGGWPGESDALGRRGDGEA